jgi:hypothetical protein
MSPRNLSVNDARCSSIGKRHDSKAIAVEISEAVARWARDEAADRGDLEAVLAGYRFRQVTQRANGARYTPAGPSGPNLGPTGPATPPAPPVVPTSLAPLG